MKHNLLFETDWLECSDWCYRHLGNYFDENFQENKQRLGHEYKNLDSDLVHNLNIDLNKFIYYLVIKLKIDDKYYYAIPDVIEIINKNMNRCRVITSKDGLFNSEDNIFFTNEDGFYKILIYERYE